MIARFSIYLPHPELPFPSSPLSHHYASPFPRPTTTMSDAKPTEYVTLVSNDGYEFKILRSAACIAGTIKKALDPLCTYPYLFPHP